MVRPASPNAGRGVTVALIDTGVADTAALNRASGRLVDAVDTSGLNTPTRPRRLSNGVFTDGYGHGTFMASLIAGGQVPGSGDTGLGVAPGATIDVVKVADSDGNTSLAAVLAGLDWVATHSDQVDVANLSLSVDPPASRYGIDPLNFAVTLTRSAGVTVVVAAGNTPGVVGDPGFGPASLTVGAADTTGASPVVASFSGYANVDGMSKPDVVAAGVNLLGEMPVGSTIDQEFPNARQASGLFRGTGTSQSTAIVSGLAALYLQSHPSANPFDVKSAIRDAASSIASGKTDGQGLVAIPTRNGHGSGEHGREQLELPPVDLDRSAVGRPVHRRCVRRSPMERSSLERVGLGRPSLGRHDLRRSTLVRRHLRRPPVECADVGLADVGLAHVGGVVLGR